MSEKSRKLGSTALRGYIHLGWAELQTLAPHATSPHAQPSNYFMPFQPTPGEVAETRREQEHDAELSEETRSQTHQRQGQGMDMEP